MRTKQQFLEMIAKTRPTAFAWRALRTQLERETFTAPDLEQIHASLELLHSQIVVEPAASPSSRRAQLSVDYRSEGMGGRGRIYAEVDGRKLRELLENAVLDNAQVYLFTDAGSLSGLQVDNAATLADRFETVLLALDALTLEHHLETVDCVEAGLEEATLSDVLRWFVSTKL